MIIRRTSIRKGIACFFLTLLTVQGLMPTVAWALTSGPSQPETKQFAQAGTSDMVDLATGNFKYNIPLLDVDGYPLNLNYQSGAGIEDEASWVGLGWNLNPGAINRQLRGIADDSNGDVLTTESYMKPKITSGGSGSVRGELFGSGISGTLSVGIFSDNYTGIGAEIGVNAGLSLTKANAGGLTAGMNVGLNSSTASGVSVTTSISLSMKNNMVNTGVALMGLSSSLGYNSREGLKSFSYGGSLNMAFNGDFTKTINYNTPPFYPKTNIPFTSTNFTARLELGGEAAGGFESIGATGYKTKREIKNPKQQNKTYGFMYAEKGKNVPDAMMDFMREKDNPIIPELNNLALPVVTPDVFSYTSQAGSGQFKLYRNGTGVIFDNETNDVSDNKSLSVEIGIGGYFHGGQSIFLQDIKTTNGKWKTDNDFLAKGDFIAKDSVIEEESYFKEAGEKNVEDQSFVDLVQGERTVSIPLDAKKATGQLKAADAANPVTPASAYKKKGRQVKRSPIMALTAEQASKAGLDKKIMSYPLNALSTSNTFTPPACNKPVSLLQSIERSDAILRKPNHISELTVTGDDGKRMVYGIPVYNRLQDEYSFAVDGTNADKVNNLTTFTLNTDGTINHTPLRNGKSTTDEYYHKESQPSYATSYLLTGILSPDYVDITGNGISEDDRGTAIKFNYTKMYNYYKWRTPYGVKTANFNRGLNADPDDDKASFVYGEKELWYPASIESRTKIAYFITEDREDGLGYDWLGNRLIGSNAPGGPSASMGTKQRRLKEIRLYSKGDLTTPIKTVVFEYSYELCPGIPNSSNGGGKLTLKKVYFKYASSSRGQNNPYIFKYDNNPSYAYLSSDRWGTYKPVGNNANFAGLKNDEFPYATRDSATAAANVSAWQLSKITMPTGGVINVTYEGDDYAYVQNKRAMQMVKFTGMLDGAGNETTSLRDAKKFKLPLTESPPVSTTSITSWFKDKYLNGESFMYSRFFVNVTDDPASTDSTKYDFVPGYGQIDSVYLQDTVAIISFKSEKDGGVDVNPFISVAWQRMRFDYPRYAYPGYKNKIDDDRPVSAVVTALASSIKNLSELWENFNKRAYRKKFAANVNMDKSFTRVVKRDGVKLGGGLRVKRITLSDEWNSMATDQSKAFYGQEYEYNTIQDGKRISSGVAAYEPSIGGDENPMRLPVKYTQDVKWGLNNYFYLEEPMGESLFPSPEVCYREVRVRNLDASGNVDTKYKTGWNTYEFYTAKEFPVIVQSSGIDKYTHNPNGWSSFFGGKTVYELAMSQGYAIFLNDMHGKPKAERVFNQSAHEISSSEYFYNATEEGGIQRLRNVVDVVDNTGAITKNQVIGREIEMFADMRQSETSNSGKSINLGADVIPIGPIIGPVPHFPWSSNDDYRLFRSACVLKTIQYYGVVNKVVKNINGSTVTASNLLYDKLTGEPVLTQSNNEFDDPVYSVSVPAYWMYKQMGPAYQTLGLLMKDFKIVNGVISPAYARYLTAGDELIDLGTTTPRWVINSPSGTSGVNVLRVIDKSGRVVNNENTDMIVRRSGYRNLLTAGATAITSMKNPVSNNVLRVFSNEELASFKILNASAIEYHEAWGQPADCNLKSCPEGYVEDVNGNCYLPAKPDSTDHFDIVAGSDYAPYSTNGAIFFSQSGNGEPADNSSQAAFWLHDCLHGCGRLNEAGIWMNGCPDQQWWGFEKCINIVTEGDYYIGYGADDLITVYVDDVLLDRLSDVSQSNQHFQTWRVRRVHFSAGKHFIRVGAVNVVNERAVALEVYNCSLATLLAGDEPTIRANTLFSTFKLKNGDHNVRVFDADQDATVGAQNYYCELGKTLGFCDGSPNCGFKAKGSCPDGYEPSADGMACVPIGAVEDNDESLNIAEADHLAVYSIQGAILHDANGVEGARFTSSFWGAPNCSIINAKVSAKAVRAVAVTRASSEWVDTIPASAARSLSVANSNSFCGQLNAAGFWLQGPFESNIEWIGVNTCLKIPESKVYYIGFGADNDLRLYIDGNPLPYSIGNGGGSGIFLDWKLHPQYLTAGNHILTIEAENEGGQKAVAVEVYNNTPTELQNGTATIIYSTLNLMDGKPYDTYVRDYNNVIVKRRFSCPAGSLNVCNDVLGCPAIPNGTVLNPYITGYLGNWLPWKQMVWLSDRSGQSLTSTPTASPAIRNNGHLTSFVAYWTYNSGWSISANTNWVTSSTTTIYDQFSQEQETKDALGRYSSARYGYKSTLPIAVGANMRQREIFYDGFDDYKFNNLCMDSLPCQPDEFNIYKLFGTSYATHLNATDAHSGNYSLKLTDSLSLNTYVFPYEHTPGIYLANNGNGEYYRNPDGWLGLRGFCPVKGRRYVFSAWVKDGQPATPGAGITLAVNNAGVTLTKKAAVEGWKLVEGFIDLPASSSDMQPLNVVLTGGGNILIDDIRIFPYDGQLKTFTYDEKTLRLMAEMDENNYATFYEYDDEGSLIRVKKETERGIMTIKENRSAYRKNVTP